MRSGRRGISRQRRLHPWLWVLFCLLWGAGIAANCWVIWRYQRQYERWQRLANPIQAQVERILDPVYDHMHGPGFPRRHHFGMSEAPWRKVACAIENAIAVRVRSVSPQRFQRLVNADEQLRLRRALPRERPMYAPNKRCDIARYRDPASGYELDLIFVDGDYQEHRLVQPLLPPYPQLPTWWDRWSRCGGLFEYRWRAWLGLCLLAVVVRPRRCLLAELLVMVSISSLLMDLPSPMNPYGWQRISKIRNLPWDLVMVAISFAVLSWAYYSHKARSRILCPVCEYNLTGNSSGVCPECGSRIPEDIRELLERITIPAGEPEALPLRDSRRVGALKN